MLSRGSTRRRRACVQQVAAVRVGQDRLSGRHHYTRLRLLLLLGRKFCMRQLLAAGVTGWPTESHSSAVSAVHSDTQETLAKYISCESLGTQCSPSSPLLPAGASVRRRPPALRAPLTVLVCVVARAAALEGRVSGAEGEGSDAAVLRGVVALVAAEGRCAHGAQEHVAHAH